MSLSNTSDAPSSPEVAVVMKYLRLAAIEGRIDEAYELVSEDFIQHNPSLPGDKTGSQHGLKKMVGGLNPTYEVKRVVSNGPLVVVHAHSVFNGQQPGYAIVDIFRVINDLIVEHWDVWQAIPANMVHKNTMF